ncbi:uncharacterized protein LY89DRAFT_758222 [Mollisia scopiformis]|uniref:Rhodopsin domain-containing protein n=1 Tax=Mollisia scopiformis TaxID=149040 RepID=A0A194WVA8_MOLSC|nr:uncharacterized protein LY89DRAFT_758222 [Mollisia scopiformis]KUJ11527.1 hypothetical protein LY89DRAFT_758222 [Mollisia scopiformis]
MSVPQSIFGLCIDLYILFIPIIGVSRLHVSTKRKFSVMLIFLSGLMACVCSAVSIHYRRILDHTVDTTWALMPVNIATLCEMFAGIICACMPSAAAASRHSGSIYLKVLNSLSTNFISLKSTLIASKKASKSGSSGLNQDQISASHPQPEVLNAEDLLRSTDRKYAQYFNLVSLTSQKSTVDDEPQACLDGTNAV